MAQNDDVIALGSQAFPIKGNVRVEAVSDFEVGLKTGKVSYDNREHAFFTVLDDFTGGFGSHYMDIREELGTFWYPDPDNSPETSYSGRVTLPLSQQYVQIAQTPTAFNVDVSVGYPFLEREEDYIFGLGSYLYSLAGLGAQPTQIDSSTPGSIVSLVRAADAVSGQARLYASYKGETYVNDQTRTYPRFGSDVWSNIGQVFIKESNPITAGVTGDVLAEDKVFNYQTGVDVVKYTAEVGGSDEDTYVVVPRYNTCIIPATRPIFFGQNEWFIVDTAGSGIHAQDIFFWDGKLLGLLRPRLINDVEGDAANAIAFLVPQFGDGLILYTIPRGHYITQIAYTGPSPSSFPEPEISSGGSGGSVSIAGGHSVSLSGGGSSSSSSSTSCNGVPDAIGSVQTGAQAVEDGGELTSIVAPIYTPYHGWVASDHITYEDDYEFRINPGQEPWNFQIEGDEQIVAAPGIARELRFIGVAPAPWGEMAVYMRGGSKLYVLDFFARKMYPIESGTNRPILSGAMWQGAITTTDGWDIFEYNPGQATQRNIGLPRKWGVTPNLINDSEDGSYQITYLIPHDDELLAIAVDSAAPASILLRWNGVGWHQVGARMNGFLASYGFRVTFPLEGALDVDPGQAIIIPGVNDADSPTEFGYWQFNMPKITHQPTVGLDIFGPSGARFHTGWMDGGFFDIEGTLLRMNCDAFFPSTSEKIIVEYRLNNDAESEETATWTTMVDADGNASAFSSTQQELFYNTTTPRVGVAFRTVQYRITLIRGSNSSFSPELRALTMVYLKTPELRTQWSFQIDINRMIESTKTEEDETFFVDGEQATLQNVWAKLRELWINNHQLLTFVVPSVLSDDQILYVKMTGMPLTFDDFRESVAGHGTIDIQLLEPVASGEA